MSALNIRTAKEQERSMNTIVSPPSRISAAGPHVRLTLRKLVACNLAVRDLAAAGLARGGAIEVDAIRVRERSVSWIALALLLAAWNVEARLDDSTEPRALAGQPTQPSGAVNAGFDWTESKATRWKSCAARATSSRGAGHAGT
jgi:hypothetical protein